MTEVEGAVVDAMRIAGIDERRIFAFRETGLIPTDANWHLLTPDDRAAWDAALAEYDRLHAMQKLPHRAICKQRRKV